MNEYTIYLGEYIPLPEVDALLQELKLTGNSSVVQPPVNIDEYEHYLKIEVVIYGVSREDILINADENILSIIARHNEEKENKKQQLHEFKHCCFDRHIILPDKVDPQFIIAEYKTGILNIYIPKSTQPLKNVHTRIPVY